MTDRRTFITGAAATAAIACHPAGVWPQSGTASPQLTLSVDFERVVATVPKDFNGLSYEAAQLGHPDFFSAQNTGLIALFRRLSPQGVLRIGGNTVDYTTWSSNDADAEKNHTPHAVDADAGTAARTASILTPLAIRNLNEFLLKAGEWRLIYGLNLWHGSPEMAAAEAAYVAKVMGPKLICFQIGNEPEMFHDAGSKQYWSFDRYWNAWQRFAAAVRQAVPSAALAGPDISYKAEWVMGMAEKRPDLVFLSGHHYAEGPPSDPKATREYLLRRGVDPAQGEFQTVHAATKLLGKPYRMTEGNTCYRGGKPGASDTLASALWSGDYMLQVAQAGYIGVNLHGGGGSKVLYTPLAGDTPQGFSARPVYYGMLLAQYFAGSTIVDAKLSAQTESQNVTAFAAKSATQGAQIAVFNKAASPVTVHIEGLHASSGGRVYLLQAPSIESRDGVTLGGAQVGSDGSFLPRLQAKIGVRRGSARLELPAYTAAYIEA